MKENDCGVVLNLKQWAMAGHQESIMNYKGFGAGGYAGHSN